MSISILDDSVFEALFRQAVIDNFNEELNSIPSNDELAKQITFSPEHETRMKKLFTRDERKERTRTIIKWARRAVAVILIAVTVLFGALMFVPSVRALVIETVTEWYEKFVTFTSRAPEAEKMNLEPGYLPEGFYEIVRDEVGMTETIIFENGEGKLIVFQSTRTSDNVSIDNENNNYEVRLIGGIEYHVFAAINSEAENTVLFDIYGQRFIISSSISVDELLFIASSIKKK